MLSLMRKHATSWLIKILLGAIVIVFVFWGVGSFRSRKGSLVASVNGDIIIAEEYNQAYNALLEQLDIKGAKVLGWSDGGIQALLLAIHHPDKVNKMAIMGANLRPDQTAVYPWVGELLQPLSDTVDEMIANKDTSDDWQHHRQLLDLLMTQPNIPVESLQQIKAPVLVMAGDKDIIRGEHTLEIFENLPNAHMAILPGQTHWAPATDPVAFNALVEKFFATPYSRPTSQQILASELNPPES